MLGYSLLRLGLFVALAIVACTAVGLFTYLVVAAPRRISRRYVIKCKINPESEGNIVNRYFFSSPLLLYLQPLAIRKHHRRVHLAWLKWRRRGTSAANVSGTH